MKQVLIVCKGNTCRSPMAVALLHDMLRRREHDSLVQVRSAGIWATEGQAATVDAQRVMRERGLDVSGHKAHLLSAEDVRQAGLLITMERGIAEAIGIEAPEAAGKVRTLGDLADDPRDVEDPVGGSLDDYRYTVEVLQGMLQRAYGRMMLLLGLA